VILIAASIVIAIAAVAAGPGASIAGNWTNPSGSVTVN
jgi:hypothetical protein